MTTSLRFLGGNGTVTGSKLLVEHDGARVLVDCGLFQGGRELRARNREPFAVDPATIDAVVLTHAHLDHVGHVPLLVAQGFRGRIHATADTVALAGIVLPDSGRLQEEEAAHAARHGYSRHAPPLPLYTEADAQYALGHFTGHDFGVEIEVADGVRAVLRPSGHILGSATAELRVGDELVVVCSGDLGRGEHPLLVDPAPPPACDIVVVESTYGNRTHEPPERSIGRLADTIVEAARRGGRVVIPAFAVDRTEVVLDALDRLRADGAIPELPVFVDSPMALAALDVYVDAVARGAADIELEHERSAELFPNLELRAAKTVEQSKKIDTSPYPCIVVSASGMATGGRVLHDLAAMLGDNRSAVVLSGFQAAGTRGRQLADGARTLKLLGRYLPVRARVVDLPGLSQHADAGGLVRWVDAAPEGPSTAFVVHGEQAASDALADRLEREIGVMAVVPEHGERVLALPGRARGS